MPQLRSAADPPALLHAVPRHANSHGVFLALVEELRAGEHGTVIAPTLDAHDLSRKINCPHCHQQMDTHFYNRLGNVIIDDRDTCALNWLDHGELMRIVRAPDYSHMKAHNAF